KEFYQFAAFFRNTTQNPMDGNIPDTPPIVVIPSKEDAPRWEQLRSQISNLKNSMRELRDAAHIELKNFDSGSPLDPASETLALTSIPATLPKDVTAGEGPDGQTPALHFTTKSTFSPPAPPEFQAAKPFSVAAWVFLPAGDAGITVASQITTQRGEKSEDDDDQPGNTTGWKIDIGGRVPSLKLLAGKSSIVVRGSNVERITPKAWTHLTFTYDGSGGQNGLSLYVNGKAVTNESDGGGNVELKGDFRNAAPLRLGGGAIAEFRVFNRELRQEEAQI